LKETLPMRRMKPGLAPCQLEACLDRADTLISLQHAAQRCLGHCRSPDPPALENSEDSVLGHQASRFKTARFVTYGEDGNDTIGPVVIWISTHPTTTTAKNAHDASPDILALLKANGVEGALVEWHEGAVEKLSGPHLLRVTDDTNPTHYVRRLLTAALGMSIATAEREAADAQGSVALFFQTSAAPPVPRSSALPTVSVTKTPPSTTSLRTLASTFDLPDSVDSSAGSMRSRPASVAAGLALASWLGRLLSWRRSRRARTRRRRRRTRRPWRLSGRSWPK